MRTMKTTADVVCDFLFLSVVYRVFFYNNIGNKNVHINIFVLIFNSCSWVIQYLGKSPNADEQTT